MHRAVAAARLVGLDLADVDLASGEAKVTGKGSKTRIVPVGRQAREALAAQPRQPQHLLPPPGRVSRDSPAG